MYPDSAAGAVMAIVVTAAVAAVSAASVLDSAAVGRSYCSVVSDGGAVAAAAAFLFL